MLYAVLLYWVLVLVLDLYLSTIFGYWYLYWYLDRWYWYLLVEYLIQDWLYVAIQSWSSM